MVKFREYTTKHELQMAKFSKDNQPKPENRSGGQSSFYKEIMAELERKFKDGEVDGYDSFPKYVASKALTDGAPHMDAILRRIMPSSKSTYPDIEFAYDPDWSHVEKANSIMTGIANGEIPPDVGHMLIDSLSKMLGIEEVTELAKRLEAIEKLLDEKKV